MEKYKYINYPNPRARRDNFMMINGMWDFAFLEEFKLPKYYDKKIKVPFTYETIESGINDQNMHNYLAYHKTFVADTSKNYLLHFDGVDYKCEIYINKKLAYEHQGCYSPFYFPIKDYLKEGENEIDVLVFDSFDKSQLRGKQRTRCENYDCWYTQYSGIYENVYLEECGDFYVKNAKFSGNLDGQVNYDIELARPSSIEIEITFKGELVYKKVLSETKNRFLGNIKLENPNLYDHNQPDLYDVKIKTIDDEFYTYFGFIEIESKDGSILINKNKTYLKMVLNQGYYLKKGISGEAKDIIKDLESIKYIGFNGVRIHQKQESHIFYYICDCLGIYIWSEIPSAYEYSEKMKQEYLRELERIIERNYNSPSVIVYVLFNESWGIPDINKEVECQEFVKKSGDFARKLDNKRLIILNDGWYQLETTDILSLHEYDQDALNFKNEYKDKNYVVNTKIINGYGKALAKNNSYKGQPIIISEFGGASLSSSSGWGYGNKIDGQEAYIEQLKKMFNTIHSLDYISGYCYTQFCDVEQETNGLFFENRVPKIPLDQLKVIIGG